ncbi:MAG: hypothetical protein ABR569_06340 [Gaiellaceae bacterium]
MTRSVALAAAVVLAAAGIFLLLLAVDVNRWPTRMAADDIAYRTDPTRRNLWQAPQILPGRPARALLALDDDVQARTTLQIFKLGHARTLFFVAGPQLIFYRAAAQALLSKEIDSDRDPGRRSQELNLYGVLQLISTGDGDPQQRQQILPRAAETFRAAMAVDPANEDAKYNLELTLRLLQRNRQEGDLQNGAGGTSAHGTDTGSGY